MNKSDTKNSQDASPTASRLALHELVLDEMRREEGYTDSIINGEYNSLTSTFTCSQPNCGRIFQKESHLKIHMSTHLASKPFKCDICGKSFVQEYNLKTHRKSHQSDFVPLRCPVPDCGRILAHQAGLKVHMRTHTNERPYKCTEPECGKSFKTIGHLNDHKKVHESVKSFACPICGNKLKRGGALKIHMKRHSRDTKYSCPVSGCTKKFIQKGNMVTHMKMHSKKKRRLEAEKEKMRLMASLAEEENRRRQKQEISKIPLLPPLEATIKEMGIVAPKNTSGENNNDSSSKLLPLMFFLPPLAYSNPNIIITFRQSRPDMEPSKFLNKILRAMTAEKAFV